jgi:hypothetical protein
MHAGTDAFAGKAERPRPNYFGPQRRRAVQMPGPSARYCRARPTRTDLDKRLEHRLGFLQRCLKKNCPVKNTTHLENKRPVSNKEILNCRRTGAGLPAFFSLLTADALNATRKMLAALHPWAKAFWYRSPQKKSNLKL